jgi:hypothetical protein
MSNKKDYPAKKLKHLIDKNLVSIIRKDNYETKKMIRAAAGRNYNDINLGTAARYVRQSVVQRIGESFINLKKDSIPTVSMYTKEIEKYENDCSFLKYHPGGQNEYGPLIDEDIIRLNNALKLSKNSNVDSLNPANIASAMLKVDESKIEKKREQKKAEYEQEIAEKKAEKNKQLKEIESEIENISEIIGSEESLVEVTENDFIDDKHMEWWERINLSSDPFNSSGLRYIKKDDYDDILVDNDGILYAKNFRKGIDHSTFSLEKNYLILGGLGTGKTAVIDYLKEFSADQNVIPLVAKFETAYSAEDISHKFYQSLRGKIKTYIRLNNTTMTELPMTFGQSELLLSLDEIFNQKSNNLKGFFIFIEDLHKQKDIQLSFDFISGLQMLNEELYDFGLPASIIISGTSDWEEKFKNDPRLTSVVELNNIIKLPDVTPSLAAKAITKRFKTFRNEKQVNSKSSHNYDVEIEYLRTVSKLIDRNREHTGYRIYFQEIKNDLEKGKSDIFSYDPSQLTKEMSIAYSELLSQNDEVKIFIDRIINTPIKNWSVDRSKQRQEVIKLVSDLLKHRFILDSSNLLNGRRKKSLINHLFKRIKIITMSKKKEWYLVKPFFQFHELLMKELSLGLNYFLPAYHLNFKSKPVKPKSKIPSELIIEKIENYWDQDMISFNRILELKKELFTLDELKTGESITRKILMLKDKRRGYMGIDIDELIAIFKNLISIDLKLISKNLRTNNDPILNWHYKYEVDDEVNRFIKDYYNQHINGKSNFNKQSFLSELSRVCLKMIKDINKRYKVLKKINSWSSVKKLDLELKDFSNDTQKIVFNNEKLDLDGYCSLVDNFQNMLRDYFFIMHSLTYGNYADRKIIIDRELPNCAIKSRMNNVPKSFISRQVDFNEFENLNRSESLEFLGLKGSIYSHEIIEPLRGFISDTIKKDTLIKTIIEYQDIDIAASHKKNEELVYKIEKYPDFLYKILSIKKHIQSSIVEKIIDNYILVRKDNNINIVAFVKSFHGKNPKKQFANLNSHLKYDGNGKPGELTGESATRFIDECKKQKIKLWEVEICKDILNVNADKRKINFADKEHIATAFGNMIYAQGVANLIFTIHEYNINNKHLFGTEFLFDVD